MEIGRQVIVVHGRHRYPETVIRKVRYARKTNQQVVTPAGTYSKWIGLVRFFGDELRVVGYSLTGRAPSKWRSA